MVSYEVRPREAHLGPRCWRRPGILQSQSRSASHLPSQASANHIGHQCFWLSVVLYCAGLFSAKMTFLLQYYRVLAVQRMRIIYIIAIVIVGAWGLSQLLIGILMCRPIRGFWDNSVEATCIPNYPQFYINAAGNIATDIAVFLLPMPVLKHLNLPKTQKLLLIGVFSLGFL